MGIDFGEKEREFLDNLEADSGRPLAAWMAAIAEQNLAHRNDIIDWLRRQGFLFAKASWLERIHHNGGRPIYSDTAAAPMQANLRAEAPPERHPVQRETSRPVIAKPDLGTPEILGAPSSPSASGKLDALLAEGKAYRPLAQYILRKIASGIPGVTFAVRPGYVVMSTIREFGVLTVSPKELRLGLALGDCPAPEPFLKARFPAPQPTVQVPLSHMVVLTDARQVTDGLIEAIARAAER